MENQYTTDFVRSAAPLPVVTNSLWMHPDENVRKRLPIGYALGVVWMEKFMEGKKGISFYDINATMDAYNIGNTSGFPSTDIAVASRNLEKGLVPPPVPVQRISSAPLHHYVHKDFSVFLARFSEYIIENKPFAGVEAMLRANIPN